MAKTLLQVVKNALAAMDSDSVDTIYLQDGGTEESEQIAMFAEGLFEHMHAIYDWPYTKLLTQLDAVSDNTKPNYLKVPQNVIEVEWLKYNDKNVTWLDPLDFVEMANSRLSTDTNVETVTGYEGNLIKIRNDRDPEYYTSFDNEYLVFDSYDSNSETTLQNTNTDTYVVRQPSFSVSDTYTIEIPDSMLPLFEAELKREASLRLRMQDSPIDAKRALANWARQRTKVDKVNKTKKKGFGRN
jgi:hypothetical protein